MIAPFATFLDVAENVGLPIVFLLIAIETMGIPVPGETALITAGIVASRGRLSIEEVIAVAAAAAILGDNVGFAIGRKLGRRLLTAPGPFLHHRRRVIAVGGDAGRGPARSAAGARAGGRWRSRHCRLGSRPRRPRR